MATNPSVSPLTHELSTYIATALHRDVPEAVGDASLTDPERRWRCVMQVSLKDGRTLEHQTMAAKGSCENPLTLYQC